MVPLEKAQVDLRFKLDNRLLSVDCSMRSRAAAREKFSSSASTIAACRSRISGSTIPVLLAKDQGQVMVLHRAAD
jgi:hypothetical protein